MICNNCQKLSIIHGTRSCVNCSKETGAKLKALCEDCSNNKIQCQVCLKQTSLQPLKIQSSCSSCGGKK